MMDPSYLASKQKINRLYPDCWLESERWETQLHWKSLAIGKNMFLLSQVSVRVLVIFLVEDTDLVKIGKRVVKRKKIVTEKKMEKEKGKERRDENEIEKRKFKEKELKP